MNVLLVGKGPKNDEIVSFFEEKGYEADLIAAEDVKGLAGQIGDFAVKTAQGVYEGELVVLAEVPATPPADIDGGGVKDLFAPDKMALLPQKDKLAPVVFLLDWFSESSASATMQALADATFLAGQKRKVYYLSRFVRTAVYGGEALYKKARNAGITFIKYEDLSIKYDYDTDKFTLSANDGVLEYAIETGTIFADGARAPSSAFEKVAKALRLTANAEGYVTEDRYFLAPVLTSRRGVYHISRDVAYERLTDGLNAILGDVADAESEDVENRNTVFVDGEKCVFCYSCYRACPHGAMEPDVLGRMMENLPMACQGCGICVSVCPGNALELLEEEELPTTDKGHKTLVMCCENSAEIAMKQVLAEMGEDAGAIEVRSVPCGGRIGLDDVSDALGDYGKVMVAVCIDDACQHFDGNRRACAQVKRTKDMLETAGLDATRVGFAQVSHAMPGVLLDELNAFVKEEVPV
ncbi:hydrogenase iron-sulfur subunit [Clostridia bacterium OttesenSCG-928-O13]|nr:hydrogenase iron-sulfur subunit [Clostridia bacterium OttesenSCG-928-O13]